MDCFVGPVWEKRLGSVLRPVLTNDGRAVTCRPGRVIGSTTAHIKGVSRPLLARYDTAATTAAPLI